MAFPGSAQALDWVQPPSSSGKTPVSDHSSTLTDDPRSKSYGLFNAKWVYILSVLLFEAGCALCGAAPTMNAMIVGRVLA